MSRKTMDEWPLVKNIWEAPVGTDPPNDNRRVQGLIDGVLDGDKCSRAYKEPWTHHLDAAGVDFTDALWGINDGKRDVRQRKLGED
jgi:hypothetical protein